MSPIESNSVVCPKILLKLNTLAQMSQQVTVDTRGSIFWQSASEMRPLVNEIEEEALKPWGTHGKEYIDSAP